jgi:hypothetical protein
MWDCGYTNATAGREDQRGHRRVVRGPAPGAWLPPLRAGQLGGRSRGDSRRNSGGSQAPWRRGDLASQAGIELGDVAGAVAMEHGEPEHGNEGARRFGGRCSPTSPPAVEPYELARLTTVVASPIEQDGQSAALRPLFPLQELTKGPEFPIDDNDRGWSTRCQDCAGGDVQPLTSPGGGAGRTTGGCPHPRPRHSTSPARRSEPVRHQDRLGMGHGPRTIGTQGSRALGRRVARNLGNTSDHQATFRPESPSPIPTHSSRLAGARVSREVSRAITLR